MTRAKLRRVRMSRYVQADHPDLLARARFALAWAAVRRNSGIPGYAVPTMVEPYIETAERALELRRGFFHLADLRLLRLTGPT
jgi:hypothetical protein